MFEKNYYGNNRKQFSKWDKIDGRLWFLHPPVFFSKSMRLYFPQMLGDFTVPEVDKYAGHKMLGLQDGNALIGDSIRHKKNMLFGRFGDVELFASCDYLIRGKIAAQNLHRLCANAGFFYTGTPNVEKFVETYIEAFKSADVLGCWYTVGEDYLIKKYNPSVVCAPLQSYAPYNFPQEPWTKELEGKKVLVISPFVTTIEEQYKKRALLYAGTNMLPEFELKTVRAVQTRGSATDDRFATWFDALDYMIDEVSKVDFDVAIAGCGGYTFPLCAAMKKMGKTVVQLGGATQLLFGIMGHRYENEEALKPYYNSAWTRVKKEEIAKGMDDANNAYL